MVQIRNRHKASRMPRCCSLWTFVWWAGIGTTVWFFFSLHQETTDMYYFTTTTIETTESPLSPDELDAALNTLKRKPHDKPPKDDHHHHHHHDNTNTKSHHHHDTTKHTKASKRPPLESLIVDNERGIEGHVSFLLDWAILGHAKAGTTFVMNWISHHPQVATWDHEVCDLYDNKPAGLVRRLYEELPSDENLKRGFKCPGHFSRRSLRYFHKYFHKTKLIIGVRHPVRWFESFYNFRMRHAAANYSLPHPNQLLGTCTPEKDGVCTDRANFQTNLAVLGKTPMTTQSEQDMIRFEKYKYEETYEIANPVFLYDVDQFKNDNVAQFGTDLERFLGLSTPLPEPTRKDAAISSRPKAKALDICLDEYKPLRQELLRIGQTASVWIETYFLKSEHVVVSQREQFLAILHQWGTDPCVQRKQEETSAQKEGANKEEKKDKKDEQHDKKEEKKKEGHDKKETEEKKDKKDEHATKETEEKKEGHAKKETEEKKEKKEGHAKKKASEDDKVKKTK